MDNILDGAKRLLEESIDILGDSINNIVFVGGWGPYLRHINEHPGTKDVDILFPESYSKEEMVEILNKFLENEFYISAKHDFQLCRAYKIGQQKYIFNIDLLHPTMGKLDKVDFVEIMDLDVTYDGIKVKQIASICIQYGDVIYSENLIDPLKFNGKEINVLDGAGIVISKLTSCHNAKRQRDIYDIYLSLLEPNTINKLNYLASINLGINEQITQYSNTLKLHWDKYDSNLREFGINREDAKDILLMGR
ncbi:nucleotidyl transferase AbiEii/AbiGii toxin family protein [Dysgonomonas sp. GY617]|uniref:nucleotidyl transferase AbiEii/AbiGii toxin family protein n=1 Tax=Dysgonomonas sp. GY617 TaxID=2780420 RepID=UPI0018834470|nr:nucleotidyl transferase AbiEii/AbiGii toxin family protein [Dysgonomonas sp. GY617]MBF0577584.1 nucleotidyl transferase AbiEii/AbiGii toxin family protein [Dysgonomonas sp. GY617]